MKTIKRNNSSSPVPSGKVPAAPRAEAAYPDFVQTWLEAHTEDGYRYKVTKQANSYCLYRFCSSAVNKRCKEYLGILAPSGFKPCKPRGPHGSAKSKDSDCVPQISLAMIQNLQPTVSNFQINEYGFSKAMFDLCPLEWKERYGTDWESQLIAIVVFYSKDSYLKDYIRPSGTRHYSGVLARSLERMLDISIHELRDKLGNIYIVNQGEKSFVSHISHEQQVFCETHHIQLGVM